MPTYRYDPARNAVNPGPVDYVVPPDGGSTTYNPQYLAWIQGGNNPREWQGEVSSATGTGHFTPRPNAYGPGTGTGGYSGGYGGGSGTFGSTSFTPRATPKYSPFQIGSAPTYTPPSLSKVPEYKANFKEMPTYTAPKWNEGEIDTLTQKRAAPGLRDLRQQVQRVTGRRYDNPQVGRMTLRDALQGYGSGVSKVMGGASEAAAGEYSQKFGRESANAQAEYGSRAAATGAYNQFESDKAKTQYSGAMAQWGAENDSAREASKMNYGSSFETWKAQNSANARKADMDFEGALAQWKAETAAGYEEVGAENNYRRQQRGFEDAWERWKRQQTERQNNPQWGGA